MLRRSVGIILLALGLAVFLVRLRHAGPYFLPEGANLAGGLGAVICGALLIRTKPAAIGGQALRIGLTSLLAIASLVSFYMALYGTLAELEEVVVVRPSCESKAGDPLRFWIVDDSGAHWISMGPGKADRTGLSQTRAVSLLRDGIEQCMNAAIVDDPAILRRVLPLLEEKYTVARVAVSLGLFGEGRYSTNQLLRLTGPAAN